MPTAPPSVTDLPTPPSRSDSANFAVRGDAFLGALPTFQTETNDVAANVYANALGADADAATASAGHLGNGQRRSERYQSASASATAAGATIWVSGTTYAIGDVRWSPATRYSYRRITNGAGTTDPSADPTNWTLAAIALPAMVPCPRPRRRWSPISTRCCKTRRRQRQRCPRRHRPATRSGSAPATVAPTT